MGAKGASEGEQRLEVRTGRDTELRFHFNFRLPSCGDAAQATSPLGSGQRATPTSTTRRHDVRRTSSPIGVRTSFRTAETTQTETRSRHYQRKNECNSQSTAERRADQDMSGCWSSTS